MQGEIFLFDSFTLFNVKTTLLVLWTDFRYELGLIYKDLPGFGTNTKTCDLEQDGIPEQKAGKF